MGLAVAQKNRNSEKSQGGLRDHPSGIELVGPNLRSKDSSRPLGETQGSLELLAGVRDLVVSPVEVVRIDNNDLALRREKSTSLPVLWSVPIFPSYSGRFTANRE